jgi:alpha-beta hydrolase superfamily lysophospholipase
MRILLRVSVVPLACLSLFFLAKSGCLLAADDTEDKIDSKRVHFPTYDEVELSGTFYRSAPAAGKKDKDAVVLLLHDFRAAKGGGSHQDGWNHLAGRLQKEGYAVFSFDFRGFGDSKSVSPKFWRFGANTRLKGASSRQPPASIDQKDFPPSYYLTLVNDIAAARTYLDVLNDAGEVNASNILVIGAGQGATLGALWMASECRRQKDNQSDRLLLNMTPQFRTLDEPEGNDLAAAVWLTIYPSLEGRLLSKPLTNALVDTAKTARIPTYFLHSKNDEKAAALATFHMNAISMENGKKVEQKGVKDKAVPGAGDLAGSKLLGERLKTTDFILDYLNRVIEDRGSRVRKDRQDQKYAFCWTMPWPSARNIRARPLAKMPGEPVTRFIPLDVLGLTR